MYGKVFGSLMTATAIVAIGSPAPAKAQFPDELDYSLPAQDLAKSLREVSVRSGRNVIAPSELVSGRRAPAVSGRFTAEGIVRTLLIGSDLEVRRVGDTLVIAAASGLRPRAPNGEADAGQEIVVTGTNLRGAAPTSPTIVITRDEIERTGASSVEQLMRKVPQNFQGGINQENFAVSGAGADITEHGAGLNLRGLGQRATLVLVNGRRLAPSGAGSFVDVSLIPLTAVERVEIVVDGASAIYGSDAVGGVVNFILRDRFEGLETIVQAGSTTGGGGDLLLAGATAGKAWRTGRAMVSYEYRHEDEILARDRAFTINLNPGRFLFPRERRHSLFGLIGQELADGLKLEVTGTYGDRGTERSYFLSGTTIPVNAAARAWSAGFTGSLSYAVGGSWRAELTGDYFVSKTRQMQEQPAGQGLVNDLETRNSLYSLGLKVDGILLQLPGGPLRLAVGAQLRHEGYEDVFETRVTRAARTGSRYVGAVFGELYIPLFSPANRMAGIERLVATIAGRYEEYDALGSTFNPKLGLLWTPVEGVTLRGSYDTSFRAPLLSESTGFYNAFYFPASLVFIDPSQARGVSLALVGSNPDIRPETSRSWTAGAKFDLAPALSLTFNYYAIRFADRIALPTPSLVVVGNPAFEPIVTRNPSAQLVAGIVQGAAQLLDLSGPGFTNGHAAPGDVTVIVDDRFNNTAVTSTRGLDIGVHYDFAAGPSRFSADLQANHILSFDDRLTTASPSIRTLNTPYHPVSWRARGGLAWSLGGWSASAYLNYTGPYRDNRSAVARRVGAFATIDFGLGYDFRSGGGWLRGTRISFVAQNALGAEPPRLVPDPGSSTGLGYDPVNASGRGRFVSLQLRRSW